MSISCYIVIMFNFTRTKIVSTIGPASESSRVILQLINAGMDVARLNFSHGTHAWHKSLAQRIRRIGKSIDSPTALLQDLQGPKIRISTINTTVNLIKGRTIRIAGGTAPSTKEQLYVSYPYLYEDAGIGDSILIDDGCIECRVEKKKNNVLECHIINGGIVTSHKGVNLPGMQLRLPALTPKDKHDAELGCSLGVDYIALSFVRTVEDIKKLNRFIKKRGAHIPIIAKIEKPEAIENIDNIIDAADAIMVARGDLGVETDPSLVPIEQKNIIRLCNLAGKPVITATQMLESMRTNPRPTRAEAADVANAVIDGSDAVMLSAETASGAYPIHAVRMMRKIIANAEGTMKRHYSFDTFQHKKNCNIARAVGSTAVRLAEHINAHCIVTFTRSGFTAALIAQCRPPLPIIALTQDAQVRRRLQLHWGVDTIKIKTIKRSREIVRVINRVLPKRRMARKGNYIVIVMGMPFNGTATTNTVRTMRLGDPE